MKTGLAYVTSFVYLGNFQLSDSCVDNAAGGCNAVSDLKNSKSGCAGAGVGVVDCPTQLTLVTWICQLSSMTNTSENYERTQQGNLLGKVARTVSPFLVL